MSQFEQKSVSYVTMINWNGVSASSTQIVGGMCWEWSGTGVHTITVTHSDSTTQEIVGNGKISVKRYDGSVYEFYGE